MAKKKILFVIRRLNAGGVEKSLFGLIRALPKDKYDIDLGVIEAKGDFIDQIPAGVRLIEIPVLRDNYKNVRGRFGAIKHNLKNGNFKDAVLIPLLYIKSKFINSLLPLYSHYINRDNDTMPEYDIAVAYQGPSELIDYYVSQVIRARQKYVWIHFDIDRHLIRKNTSLVCYKNFERVMVVSPQIKVSFDRKFPMFADKSEVILNIIDKDENLRLSRQTGVYEPVKDALNIVTVGRLTRIKGQDIAIKAAKILKDKGIRLKWTFVGEGEYHHEFTALTEEYALKDQIEFVGATSNPYPYMAKCDVYVQPSRNEGYCITIGEAKLFGVPIVATDFVGAREQLSEIPNAIIIPDNAPETLAEAILEAAERGKIESHYEGNPPQVERLIELFG